MLYSLLGVKYLISRETINWPGFSLEGQIGNLLYYRNEMALPLGIVQSRQIRKAFLSNSPPLAPNDKASMLDVALINAVIVDEYIPQHGELLDEKSIIEISGNSIQSAYYNPARSLQQTGLKIEKFSNNHIVGRINPIKDGILVFSIPFNSGWSMKIDETETPLIRANFGMLAGKVKAGANKIELFFRPPGWNTGIILGSFGILLLWLLVRWQRKHIDYCQLQ